MITIRYGADSVIVDSDELSDEDIEMLQKAVDNGTYAVEDLREMIDE